jgi:hypothetical protein
MKKIVSPQQTLIDDVLPLSKTSLYIHSRTGVMLSLWKIKRWVNAGWIHLIAPVGYDRRRKYVLKSEIDRFIKEHTE